MASPVYPSWRFGSNGKHVIVQNQAEDEKLTLETGPDGDWTWHDSPAKAELAAWEGRHPDAPKPPAVPLTDEEIEAAERAARDADIHSASAKSLIEMVEQMANADLVSFVGEAEGRNPKGARKTVLEAVEARLDELTKPAEGGTHAHG